MTFINSSGRRTEITIEGTDYSKEFIHFECGDDEISESGIIFCQGTVKLQETTETLPFSLDDRINSSFKKGNKVSISVEDFDFHRSIMWIRESHYDLKERVQTLQVCDLLSLLSKDGDFGDSSKVCAGRPKPVFEVINNLLASRGAPLLFDVIPGEIEVPVQGKNPISLVGEIAWSCGYIIYMVKEQVKAKKIRFTSGGGRAKSIENIIDYDRISTGEVPPDEIIITGESSTVQPTYLNNNIYSYSRGQDFWSITRGLGGGNYRSIFTEVHERGDKIMPWYFENRIGGVILSQIKTEEYQYETRVIANKEEEDDCNDNIERYLKKRVITTLQPFGVVLREWILLHELDRNKNIVYTDLFGSKRTVQISPFQLIVSEQEITEYLFSYGFGYTTNTEQLPPSNFEIINNESSDNTDGLVVQRKVTRKIRPGGAIFAKAFKLSARTISFPAGLTDSEYHEEYWQKIGGEYGHKKLELISFATHDSAAAEALYKQDEEGNVFVSTNSYTGLIIAKEDFEISSSGSTQPPAPETAPPEYKISNSQKSFKFKIRSPHTANYTIGNFAPAPQNYSLPWLLAGGESVWKIQAETVGNNLMSLTWGRYKGIEVTDEAFGSFEPLSSFGLAEPNGAYFYISDGFAVSVTRDQCLCRYVGLWAGGSGGSTGNSNTTSGSSSGSGSSTITTSTALNQAMEAGTNIAVGGTIISHSGTVANQLIPGASQIVLTSPIPSTIAPGSILQLGNGRTVVVREQVSVGSITIPVHPSAVLVEAGTAVNYQQLSGGTQVTVAQYVPAGSTEIPVTTSIQIAEGTQISWVQTIVNPPFQLISPIENTLILYGTARSYSPAVLPTQSAQNVLKIYGNAPKNPQIALSRLRLLGTASTTIPARYSMGKLRITSKAIAYPNMAGNGSRVRERNFTPQSSFPLELGLFLRVDWIRIVIWEPFGNGWLLSVGDATNNQRFVTADYLNPSESLPNILEVNPGYQYAQPTMIYLYQSGSSQAGTGTIYISQG